MRSGKMCFASWDEFRDEFMAAFCPENEVTTALMRLESDQYFQGKRNVEAYIDEFKDLVDLSRYTDPIAIVLKFRRGLNPTTQDRIAESGTDRPQDRDFEGWFKAACCRDLDESHGNFADIANRTNVCQRARKASRKRSLTPSHAKVSNVTRLYGPLNRYRIVFRLV
jgi:hypothetical protein